LAVRRTLGEILEDARAKIERFAPTQAFTAARNGALIIDIRSEPNRDEHGIVPGSVHIPRTVLEWRVAPDSAWRNPHLGPPERQLIILCDHGCSSSLAAATLVDLGLDATDVIGGFEAWIKEGLPATAPRRPLASKELPGMGRPEPE
jgi:rhodanese-related sulfurtransferase